MDTMNPNKTGLKNRLKSFTLPGVLVCTLALPAFAQSSDGGSQPEQQEKNSGGFHRNHHWRGTGMWERLNLTEAQKTEMKQIREGYAERTRSLHQELQAKKGELRQANQGETFNETLATQVLTDSAALKAKLMGERFKMRQEMMAVLTAEQKNQLQQMREEHKMKKAERQS